MSLDEVIKGLEELYGFLFREYANIPAEESKIYYERTCAIRDALTLLKEQEAVKPIPYHRSDGTIFKYECKKCRTKIFKMDLFCRHCGRSVKWDV